MEIRHLRYFVAVAQHRNFTRAASQLGIAPPTLTRQIQDLEEDLNTMLFIRAQRDVQLTEAGAALLDEAQLTLKQFDKARVSAQRAGRGDSGHVALGYVASAAFSGLLQQQLGAFREQHPDIQFSITEQPMGSLPSQIDQGLVDLAYVRTPMTLLPSLNKIELQRDDFILALSAGSWLCELDTITAHHLQTETFILPEQISGTLEVARQGAFPPALGPQPGSLLQVLAMVSLGEGVAIVPGAVVGRITLPHVVFRPIADCRPRSGLSLLYRQHEKSAAVRRFIDHARVFENT